MSLQALSALALNVSAHIEASARDLQQTQEKIFSKQYLEVKGDLVIFRNSNELFNHIRAVLKKAKDAAQAAISTLNQYATSVRAMDDRGLFAYVMVNFLGLRQNDPSVMEFLSLLSGSPGSPPTSHLTRAVDETLRNVAAEIHQKKQFITEIESQLPNRFEAWVGLDNNAFNWKTQKFETTSKWNVGGKLANWATINTKLKSAKSSALSGIFAAGLTRAGLPAAALQPTSDMLARIILSEAKA